MRCFLYLITACLFSFTAGAKSFDGIDTNNFCDPPLVFSATICSGESITRGIQAPDPAYTYNWYADAGHTILLATGTSFTTPALYNSTDYYVVAVLGSCMAETMITININTVIPPIVPNDTNCILTVSSAHPYVRNPQPGYIYNWYAFDGTLLHTGVDYTFSYIGLPNWTNYTVEAVNGSCRSERVEVVVMDVVQIPAYSHDTTICKGDVATLIVDGFDPSYSYTWYEAENMLMSIGGGPVLTTAPISIPKTYFLIATFRDCQSSPLAVHVNTYTIPVPTASDVSICQGNTAQLSVQNPVAGTIYTWYQDPQGTSILNTGDNYTTSPVYTPTTFYVGANDGVCATGSTLTPVEVSFPLLDSPIVTATHADFNNITFSWLPVTNTGSYEVSVNGGPFIIPSSGSMGLTHTVSGLSHSQPVAITVKAIPSAQSCGNVSYGHAAGSTYGVGFYVPSAFTPNGDARNDILKPIIPFGSVLEYFTIYDRWGKIIFTTNKNAVGWDGKVAGKDQPVGTYVWICRYLFAGRTEREEKGSFVLLH